MQKTVSPSVLLVAKLTIFKKLQCGHFQSRRHTATRWNEQNCQVQCVKCNMFNQGMQWRFGNNLDSKYGKGTSQDLFILAHKTVKMTRADYVQEIDYYKSLVENFIDQN